MTTESSLPSYDRIFRDLEPRGVDDARSVYSPAAYLADLLQLLHDHFENPALVQRRPAIDDVPLDTDNTYTVLPYLDIVNEVLAASLDTADTFKKLRSLRYPAALPFVRHDERVRILLEHLGVEATELYALFATPVDPDTTARLRLGLSADDVAAIAGPSPGTVEDPDAEDFGRANGLSAADLQVVLGTSVVGGGGGPALDADVRDRAVRFVRLARKTGLAFPDLDLLLRSCCGGALDRAALRTVAALLAIGRSADLPIDVVCSLVAPLDTAGLDGTGTTSTLFDRVFNAAPTAAAPVLVPTAPDPATNGRRVLACAGDILAPRNREFRGRVGRALGLADGDLTAIVERFRARSGRWPARPFDRTDTTADLSLLHRVSRLVTALDTSVAELFSVLDVLDADPSFPASLSFPVPVAHEPTVDEPYRMLDAAEIDSTVCLVQALFAVVPWMRAQGFTGAELAEIAGSGAAGNDRPDVLRTLADAFDEVALTPDVFRSDRFGERAAEVVHDIVVDNGDGVVSSRDARLLQVEPAAAELAAYTALVELGAVTAQDFVGLGLGERLAAKVFANLVHQGVLGADGILDELMLPLDGGALTLTTDFDGYRDALVARVLELQVGDVATVLYPSDLADLGLTDAEAAELYDNLVFHGYLDSDGQVLLPDVFAQADDPDVFVIDVDLDDVAPAVVALLRERVDDFRAEPLVLDPEIFAPLGLGERVTDLLDSLRFNGYLDAEGVLTDKTTLAALELVDLNLALEFYPHRRRVLDAVQDWIAAARRERLTLAPDDFADIAGRGGRRADHAAARRHVPRGEPGSRRAARGVPRRRRTARPGPDVPGRRPGRDRRADRGDPVARARPTGSTRRRWPTSGSTRPSAPTSRRCSSRTATSPRSWPSRTTGWSSSPPCTTPSASRSPGSTTTPPTCSSCCTPSPPSWRPVARRSPRRWPPRRSASSPRCSRCSRTRSASRARRSRRSAVALTGTPPRPWSCSSPPSSRRRTRGATTSRSLRRIRTSVRRTAGCAGSLCSSRSSLDRRGDRGRVPPTRTSSASSRRR